MAADDATCAQCGRRLTGKDRFETRCAACREAALLGAAPPPEAGGIEEAMARPRSSAGRLVLLALAGVVVVAAAAVLAWPLLVPGRQPGAARRPGLAPPGPAPPAPAPRTATPAPEPRRGPLTIEVPPAIRQETLEFLSLLRAKEYERILDNYVEADEGDFLRVQRALEQLVQGPGAQGFGRWSRLVIRLGALKAIARLRQAGDPHPVYTVELLIHLTRDPEASSAHVTPERRARNVLAWHIAGLYDGLDLAGAKVAPTATQAGEETVVGLECDGASTAVRPGDDPRRVRWRRLPVGLVLKFALADRLEAVRDLVGKPTAAAAP